MDRSPKSPFINAAEGHDISSFKDKDDQSISRLAEWLVCRAGNSRHAISMMVLRRFAQNQEFIDSVAEAIGIRLNVSRESVVRNMRSRAEMQPVERDSIRYPSAKKIEEAWRDAGLSIKEEEGNFVDILNERLKNSQVPLSASFSEDQGFRFSIINDSTPQSPENQQDDRSAVRPIKNTFG